MVDKSAGLSKGCANLAIGVVEQRDR